MQVFCKNARGGGVVWESPSATNLKGWDDSYLLLHYKNAEGKSRILLLYNDGKIAESSNSRRSLGLYYLADSANYALDSAISKHEVNSSIFDEKSGLCSCERENRTISSLTKRATNLPDLSHPTGCEALAEAKKDEEFIFLQNIDAVDEIYPNEVSYPSAVIDENALFVGYTYNRKAIKLQKINLADIERKIAESTSFGGLESRELKMDSSFCKSKKKQKLLKELCEAPENSPASWCKKSGEASSSASADFLLEADKRGSPPKSEKRQLLGTHFKKVGGSGAGGAALLRKESSEISGEGGAESSTQIAESTTFCHSERSEESQKSNQNRDSSVASLSQNDNIKKAQNDKIMNFAESSAKSTINYDILGIYLLFLAAFFFATNSLSKRAKYLALPCFVALISIPFIFVLWDYYSIVNLFYSLFGGASVFCALLCIRYIAIRLLRNLCGSLKNPRSMDLCPIFARIFLRNPQILRKILKLPLQKIKQVLDSANSQNLALTLAIFSIPLFLGHLDLISVDILRSGIASAIFASAFIVALFWADKVAFVLALVAVIIDKDFIFGLFDGYLLIFSVIYCAIWAIKSAFKKIIARA